jgi:hypothetical protein
VLKRATAAITVIRFTTIIIIIALSSSVTIITGPITTGT